jgi:GIY-YIG catalytic domain-containing protein
LAPRDASSSARLSSRLLGQHIGGNIGSSTFRLALASLLWESQDWTPRLSGSGKLRLDAIDNRALSQWQLNASSASVRCVTEPWRFEDAVIRAMRPPMNRNHNAGIRFTQTWGPRALLRARARG